MGDACEESSGAASGEGTVRHDRTWLGGLLPMGRFAFDLSAEDPPTGNLVYRIKRELTVEMEFQSGGAAGPIGYVEVIDGTIYASGRGRMSGKIALLGQDVPAPAEPEAFRSGTKYWGWCLIAQDAPPHLELRLYTPGATHRLTTVKGSKSNSDNRLAPCSSPPLLLFSGPVISGGITIQSSDPIEFDIVNEDGTTPTPAPAGFVSAKEVFFVGDGGSGRPDSLIYRVTLSNLSTTDTATNVVIRDSVGPNNAIIACRAIVASVKPAASSAAPTTCTLGDRGWEWTVGDLPPSSQVELYFRAEALGLGADVNRVRVEADQAVSPYVDDEATTVTP